MSYIPLELICHNVEPEVVYLPLSAHVHKYVDRFLYSDRIGNEAVPLIYFESPPLDSWRNIQIVDQSWSIPANDVDYAGGRDSWVEINSTSYSTSYSEIAATDRVITDSHGRLRPLFFLHELPEDTVEATLQIVGGDGTESESGYDIDLDAGCVYTNYRNQFNPVTGAYRLHYVISTNSSGSSTTELLNPRPVAKLADWEDIESDGTLTTDYPVYSVETSASGYTYYFNGAGPWYIRRLATSVIKPRLPAGRDPGDPWYIRFTAGEFTALVNQKVRRYWLPEYDAQAFFPAKPYIFSPYKSLSWVNSRTLSASGGKIAVYPSKYMHFQLFVYDQDETLIRVISTDTAQDGTRYSNTDVFIECNVLSWDNEGGFVSFGVDIDSSWSYYASLYYEADDFEFTDQSLNPFDNDKALEYLWVYYLVPDVGTNDKALHLLGVDPEGKIAYCSQGVGATHPNLQLFDSSGAPNSETVIGMRYISTDSSVATFTSEYTSGYANDNAYFVLAEVLCLDTSRKDSVFTVDVRRAAGIDPSALENAVHANPRILQSLFGSTEDGMQVPESGVLHLRPPLTLLEDYGGDLTEQQVESYLRSFISAAVATVVTWDYPETQITGEPEVGRNLIQASFEGTGLTYNFYRRTNTTDEWVLIHSVSPAGEINPSYYDSDVSSGDVYYYTVRIEKEDIEFPGSNVISISTR